jgi:LPS-assembly protein
LLATNATPYLPPIVMPRFLPALFLATTALLCANPTLPEISAPRTDINADETIFSDGARLSYDGALLLADEIRYNPKTQVAVAKGNVSLTRGAQRLLADELTYKLEDRSYTVRDFRLGEHPVYVTGRGVLGSRDKVVVDEARVSYAEPGSYAPTLRASSLTYVAGDSIQARNAMIGVGALAPVIIPNFKQTLDDPLLSNLTLKAGYASRLGGYLEAGLLAPVTPGFDAGGELSLYTSRGALLGPALDYKLTDADGVIVGNFRSGYIYDFGDRRTDIAFNPVPANRGFVGWDHYQTHGEHLTILGQLNYWSDSEITRDFRPDYFAKTQTPDNFLEFTYTGDNAVASAFTRFQPNAYHLVQQRLPEVRFDGLPIEIGAGIYHRVQASIAVLVDNDLSTIPVPPIYNKPVTRLDTYYALTRRFTPREWLSVQPVAGTRITHYFDTTDAEGSYTRLLGEFGFDAELHATNTFSSLKNERWQIDGLRHVFKPNISYRYIPDASQGAAFIPPIDREAFSTYLQPLGLGARRDIDTLKATNILRLALDNAIQTRDARYGSRNLAEFNVATDWNLDVATSQRALSALHTELALMPAPWLRFDLYQSIDPNDGKIQELNTGVTLRDADIWSLRLATHYLTDNANTATTPSPLLGIQEYTTDLRYRLNEVYQALLRINYDARASRFTRQSYGLRQNIRNLWFVEYALTFSEGSRREGSFGFSIQVELASF